jgi:hypothetical protein
LKRPSGRFLQESWALLNKYSFITFARS